MILHEAAEYYSRNYHVYFALVVCVFGSIANILNIAVLTKKEMMSTPINRILTGLAVADLLIMLEYIPYTYSYHVMLQNYNFSYSGALFMLFHTHFTQILHTISICLTLTLAIWRYLAIGYPDKNHILCSDRRCTWAIVLSYFLPLLLCTPTYFFFSIKMTVAEEDGTEYNMYHLVLSPKVVDDFPFIMWMYGVVIKLLPCALLTLISCWLIRTLFNAKKRKQVLHGYNVCPLNDLQKKKAKSERRADRTTKMLVAVMVLFFVTEFPQGIFSLVIAMRGTCFFLECYQKFGALMDFLALLNGSINFILYCCMNRMFRSTFGQMFRDRIVAKWIPPSVPSDVHTTSDNGIGTNTTNNTYLSTTFLDMKKIEVKL